MKKKIFLTALSLTAIIACDNFQVEDFNLPEDASVIKFSAGGLGLETKAFSEATLQKLQSGWNCLAKTNEDVKLFNETLAYNNGIYKPTSGTYYYPLENTMSFYGCYPASLDINSDGTIDYTQNPDTDLITAFKSDVTAQTDPVEMTFSRALAQFQFNCQSTDNTVESYLKNIYISAPQRGTYDIGTTIWTDKENNAEYSVFENIEGIKVPTETMQAFGETMTFIPGDITIRVVWESRNIGTDMAVASYDQSITTTIPQGQKTTVNIKLPNQDANDLTFDIKLLPWENKTLDINFASKPDQKTDTLYLYGYNDAIIVPSSFIEKHNSGVTVSSWTCEYSNDNGITFETTKPNWSNWLKALYYEDSNNECLKYYVTSYNTIDETINLNGLDADWTASNAALTSAAEKGSSSSPVDLSMCNYKGEATASRNTANCYVISAPGWYSIPLVYGNAIKNGTTNIEAFYTSVATDFEDSYGTSFTASSSPYLKDHASAQARTVATAEVLWNDSTCGISDITIDEDKMTFNIPSGTIAPANILLAAKDSEGEVMWSYHIWVTGLDLSPKTITNKDGVDFDIMPYNLGWNGWEYEKVTINTYETRECLIRFKSGSSYADLRIINNYTSLEGTIKQFSPYYQWGRKDPFIAYGEPTVGGDISYLKVTTKNPQSTAHKNPKTHYYCSYSDAYSWTSDNFTYFWDSMMSEYNLNRTVTKTIYDPCPAGWSIPQYNTFTGFNYNEAIFDNNKMGWKITDTIHSAEIFFPFAGYRFYDKHVPHIGGIGGSGNTWLSTPLGAKDGRDFYYNRNKTKNDNQAGTYRAYGLSVRPLSAE